MIFVERKTKERQGNIIQCADISFVLPIIRAAQPEPTEAHNHMLLEKHAQCAPEIASQMA